MPKDIGAPGNREMGTQKLDLETEGKSGDVTKPGNLETGKPEPLETKTGLKDKDLGADVQLKFEAVNCKSGELDKNDVKDSVGKLVDLVAACSIFQDTKEKDVDLKVKSEDKKCCDPCAKTDGVAVDSSESENAWNEISDEDTTDEEVENEAWDPYTHLKLFIVLGISD